MAAPNRAEVMAAFRKMDALATIGDTPEYREAFAEFERLGLLQMKQAEDQGFLDAFAIPPEPRVGLPVDASVAVEEAYWRGHRRASKGASRILAALGDEPDESSSRKASS